MLKGKFEMIQCLAVKIKFCKFEGQFALKIKVKVTNFQNRTRHLDDQ